MPIYEYSCKNCGHVFEEWYKKMSDATAQCACPKCAGLGEQIISNTSFALKGGGWYVTEYGNKKVAPEHTPAVAKDNPALSGNPSAEPASASVSAQSGQTKEATPAPSVPKEAPSVASAPSASVPTSTNPA